MNEPISEKLPPVTLVFSSDRGYLPYLLVVISSAIRHMSPARKYEIVVLATEFTDFHGRCLKHIITKLPNVELRLIDVTFLDAKLDGWFESRGRKGHVTSWSYTTYYRLFLGSLLTDRARALYLDVDMLVCDDPARLFDCDMQGCTVACVEDTCLIYAPAGKEMRERLSRNGHDVGRYFNAGTMLIDLDRWRARESEREIERLFIGMDDLFFPDQDILNTLFREDRASLPCRWNFLTSRLLDTDLPREVDRQTSDLVRARDYGVIHYVGGKPWAACGSAPLSHLWWEEAKRVREQIEDTCPEAGKLRARLVRPSGGRKLFSLRCQSMLLWAKSLFADGERRRRYHGRRQRMGVRMAELRSYK